MLLTTLQTARASAANRATRRAAFTLLEVLIVVAILVILASAASFAYFRYLEDARVGRAKGEMRVIKSALEKYHMENGQFPEQDQIQIIAPYLEQGSQGLIDPWGQPYRFAVDSQQDAESVDGGVRVKVYVICNGAPGRGEFTVPDQNTGR
jgi:general secretion pathway protein G